MLIDAKQLTESLEAPQIKLPSGEVRTGRLLSHAEMLPFTSILENWQEGKRPSADEEEQLKKFLELMGFKAEEIFALAPGVFVTAIVGFFLSHQLPRINPAAEKATPGAS